jgi:hypothetical protein
MKVHDAKMISSQSSALAIDSPGPAVLAQVKQRSEQAALVIAKDKAISDRMRSLGARDRLVNQGRGA